VQLTFDADVEAFRAEFVAFLDEHLPTDEEAQDRSHSSSDVPDWARRWQRLMFENGWLCPGHPPEFGGRNATILQQYVHQVELTRRGAYLTFNPQGVGIIAASLISFGTAEQQQKWAIPILRADLTASLGMSGIGWRRLFFSSTLHRPYLEVHRTRISGDYFRSKLQGY
jgi:alkylation response protein AidB-like acyl-CoA dehydrogenase